MVASELAKAYCFLDRRVFLYSKMIDPPLLERTLGAVEKQVRKGHGAGDLTQLYQEEGCERDELLWLLLGCWGPALVLNCQQLFGWESDQLKKNLDLIRNCADVTASLRRTTFGVLLQAAATTLQSLPENLRDLAKMAEAAKQEFKNAEWFRSLAKIRITDHVTYKSNDHKPHDKQVSGLIAAVTGKDYDADAHRRFRNKYRELLSDRERDPDGLASVDPYTVRNDSRRQETISGLEQSMKETPEFSQVFQSYVLSFAQLFQKLSSLPNRKVRKKRH